MTPYIRIGIVLEVIGSYAATYPWQDSTVAFFRSGHWLNITDRVQSDFPEIETGGERGWFKSTANDVTLTVADEDEAVLAIITSLKHSVKGEDPYDIIFDNVAAVDYGQVMRYLESKNELGGISQSLYRIDSHVILEIYDEDRGINSNGLLFRGICPYTMKRSLSPNITQEITAYNFMTKFMQRRRVTLNPADTDNAAVYALAVNAYTIEAGSDYDMIVGVDWHDGAAWRLSVLLRSQYAPAMDYLMDNTDSQNIYGVKINGTRAPQVLKIQKEPTAIPIRNRLGFTGEYYGYIYVIDFALNENAHGEYVQPFGIQVQSAPITNPKISDFDAQDNDRLVTLFERPSLVEWFRLLVQKLHSPAAVNHPIFAQASVYAMSRSNGSDNYGVMLGSDHMVCDWYKPTSAETIMQELCKYSGGRWWADYSGVVHFRPRTSTNETWDIADEYIEEGDTLELDSYDENEHLLEFSLGDSLKLTENPDNPYDTTTDKGKRLNFYRLAFRKQPEYRDIRIPYATEWLTMAVGDKIRSLDATGTRRDLGRIMKLKWPNYDDKDGQMIEINLEYRG